MSLMGHRNLGSETVKWFRFLNMYSMIFFMKISWTTTFVMNTKLIFKKTEEKKTSKSIEKMV